MAETGELNQICREQRRARCADPHRLSGNADFPWMLVAKEMATTIGRIKLAKDSREGRVGFAETASAAEPEFCTWQQARSPAEKGTGQFGPQQGALIATSACATALPKPACSASTNASKAMIPFRTGLTYDVPLTVAITSLMQIFSATTSVSVQSAENTDQVDPESNRFALGVRRGFARSRWQFSDVNGFGCALAGDSISTGTSRRPDAYWAL